MPLLHSLYATDGEEQVIGGLTQEVIDRLVKRGEAMLKDRRDRNVYCWMNVAELPLPRTQHYRSQHWDGTFDGPRPCVFGNAFRASDGREALFFANATAERQAFSYVWRGRAVELELEPDEIRMIEQ